MKTKMVTEAGFYDGKFQKPGANVPDFENMSREELLAAAKERNHDVTAKATKDELLALLMPPPEEPPEPS